ncbi:hypothetical protein AAGF08_13280 [Algoriphagus sp. SE2]|uniref:hypothetical protein n=1 Tax=Algoriphagus sp. SE2 TaxID=3141536 RepID=UPI0031CD4EC5
MLSSTPNQLLKAGNVIRITVRVADLFKASYPPADECAVIDNTKLEDQGGDSDYGQPKNSFTTDVKMGGAIVWQIEYEDNTERRDYTMELICVSEKKTSPCEFFEFDPLLPTRNLILATPTKGSPNDIYKYNIIFNITDNYRNSKTYVIDPKLRMT